jgi:pyruvate/2-oxoglutarate dehydrogenase complex dihydrolipoamide dehydrogenase (E3) component
VQRGLEMAGAHVITNVSLERVERGGSAKRVVATVAGRRQTFEAPEIFVALGREPNVSGLDLDKAGVERAGKGIKVNEYLQTSNPDIYAAGDAVGSRELVHVAVYEGQLAAEDAFTGHRRAADYDAQEAHAVFTDPQVGVAGLTERDCLRRGIPYEVASYPFSDHGKAISTGQTRGFVKILAAPADGRILGVTFVGPQGSDLIHEGIALLHFRATCDDVMNMPHLHPTMAEIITYPAEELCDRIEHRAYALVTP